MQPAQPPADVNANRTHNTAQHRCNYCQVTFTRSEHLKRHQTMHSKHKAFACPFCGKRFARSDVLSRHYQSCKQAQQADEAPARASQRVNRACSSCRLSKVKCSGNQPCNRCCSTGQSERCQFTLRKLRQTNTTSATASHNQDAGLSPGRSLLQDELPSYQHQPDFEQTATRTAAGGPVLVADQGVQAPRPAQQTPEFLCQHLTNEPDTGPSVDLGFGPAPMAALPSGSMTNIALNDGAVNIMNLSDVGPGISFDLDPLDWGLLDNSFMLHQDDGQESYASSGSPNQGFTGLDFGMGWLNNHGDSNQRGPAGFTLPMGIDVMQISPLEAHRMQILQYLGESGLDRDRWECWLSPNNMFLFVRSYFGFFHQHTPLLHLPRWNVSTASTRLMFSISLMGAMYSGNLKLDSKETQRLCNLAQSFAWETDPDLEATGVARLDTIQAVYIAVLLEAFYFPSKKNPPGVSVTRLCNEARKAGIFQPISSKADPWKQKWTEWATQECRIRTAFILYLFDVIQAILFDRRPELHLQDLNLPLPCDESVFSAANEEEWRDLYSAGQDLTRAEYPVILSLFICPHPVEIRFHFSVMGAFTILHGILLHMWEQKRIHLRKESPDVPDMAEQQMRDHLAVTQSQVIDNALRLWKVYWDKTVSRLAPTAPHGLYRDRALVYWFLGNAINRRQASAGCDLAAVSGYRKRTLKIPRLLRKLSVLADSGQLDGVDQQSPEAAETMVGYLKELQETEEADPGVERVDTVILSCMMRGNPGRSDGGKFQ